MVKWDLIFQNINIKKNDTHCARSDDAPKKDTKRDIVQAVTNRR